MRHYQRYIMILLILLALNACQTETETKIIETPNLDLKMTGPMFSGPNTATVTWEYSIAELIPDVQNVQIENARITGIKITPKNSVDYPELGQIVMEVKPKDAGMSRVGLLEHNFDTSKANNLSVAEVQEDFDDAFEEGKLTFVADIDMIAEEYFDDLTFDLVVTFEIEIEK